MRAVSMSKHGFLFLILLYTAFICLTKVSFSAAAADTLFPNQTIRDQDQDTLVSSDQTFELGFFSPGSSKNRYLGIWFKHIPDSIVWVANRNDPLTDKNGTLSISSDGNLILLNNSQHIVWSSNTSATVQNPVAQLQNTGNFVLRDSNVHISGSATDILWQSFDHPVDTYLAGMKLGRDLETGHEWYLNSWKSSDDPSLGDYTYRLNSLDLIQFELFYKGSTKRFRTGLWNGIQYSGTPINPNIISRTVNVFESSKTYTSYEMVNSSLYMTKVVLNQTTGTLQRIIANRESATWTTMYQMPNDPCDEYGKCGANGICRVNGNRICDCLEGYMPSLLVQWELLNWTGGCVRKIQPNCSDKVGFRKVSWVKLPDLVEFSVDKKMSLGECRSECSNNCNCTAFANSDVRRGGSGCIMWLGNLIDIKEFKDTEYKQDLYIRLTAAETRMHRGLAKAAKVAIITAVSAFSAVLILAMSVGTIIRKRQMNRRGITSNIDDIDLPIFDMAAISVATNNFSQSNIIGVGGFGPVYKGSLPTGQEIAVKRLSKTSRQGIEEFMNEVRVIARLQHKNLVALLGCCIEGEEKMLIYEYMPNKSLDYFIFDHDRSYQLEWSRRFDIAVGIARGLLYLHQDSKLRIIHRDLKTSNILLDQNLQPKISDFGLARIFVGDEKEARTRRVIGTYGYMSPEYAFDGKFSATSDVYSYGVLLLEVVSGKKNRGFRHPTHHHNLIGHAWLLWNEGRALELMDKCLDDSSVECQVERCIQVSLLCVQKYPQDRPEMSSVVFMLVNEEAVIAQPKEPGFFMERLLPPPSTTTQSSNNEDFSTGNKLTVTMIDGR